MILQLELEQLKKELESKGTFKALDAAHVVNRAIDEIRNLNHEIDHKIDYISELNIEYTKLMIERDVLKAEVKKLKQVLDNEI